MGMLSKVGAVVTVTEVAEGRRLRLRSGGWVSAWSESGKQLLEGPLS